MEISDSFVTFYQEEMVDMRVYQSGTEQCLPLKYYGPIARSHYLFHFIHNGSGRFETYDTKGNFLQFDLYKNQGFFTVPGQVSTYIASEDDPWKYSWIEVDGVHANRLFSKSGLSQDNPTFKSKNEQIGSDIGKSISAISHANSQDTMLTLGQLYFLMDNLEKGSAAKENLLYTRREDDYVRNAILFIENNFSKDIMIQDIADFCRLNATYLGKIFKQVTGKGMKEFLIDIRLNKSMDLMRSTQLTIKEVSEEVGYPNQLHFSKAFHSRFNISPSDWRKKNIVLTSSDLS